MQMKNPVTTHILTSIGYASYIIIDISYFNWLRLIFESTGLTYQIMFLIAGLSVLITIDLATREERYNKIWNWVKNGTIILLIPCLFIIIYLITNHMGSNIQGIYIIGDNLSDEALFLIKEQGKSIDYLIESRSNDGTRIWTDYAWYKHLIINFVTLILLLIQITSLAMFRKYVLSNSRDQNYENTN